MNPNHLCDCDITDLGSAAEHLAFPRQVLLSLLTCIKSRNVQFKQVPGLLQASCHYLASIQEQLATLLEQCGQGQGGGAILEHLATMLNTGRGFSPEDLAACLEQLEHAMAAASPAVLATVLECRALAAASMQNHMAAVEFCRQAENIQDIGYAQRWHLGHLQANLLETHGREFSDDDALQASLELLKTHVLALAKISDCPDKQAVSLESLGKVLGTIGQRRMGIRYLEEAIDSFCEALKLRHFEADPAKWAAAHNGLGNALGALGQRQSDDELLKQAVQAFEQALEFRTEEQSPDDWASTMNNLAAVLQSLGQKTKDPKILKRAVEAYKAALRVWTRSRVPIDWATTMHNLGTALCALGEHRRGPRTLEQAVAAYQSALAERSREKMPEEWAITQNNLGTALQKLAMREESPVIMQRAAHAYENTLSEWTQDKLPMTWAMTMANLGVARRELALMTGEFETADRAVDEISSAVKVFRGASHAQYTELGEEQLSIARQLRTQLIVETDSDHSEAVRLALKINT